MSISSVGQHRHVHLDDIAVHALDSADHAGEHLVYRLRKPTVDGRTEMIFSPLQLLDRLARLVTPPRIHKHRYCGVLAPNARLRQAVTASAGPPSVRPARAPPQRELGFAQVVPAGKRAMWPEIDQTGGRDTRE